MFVTVRECQNGTEPFFFRPSSSVWRWASSAICSPWRRESGWRRGHVTSRRRMSAGRCPAVRAYCRSVRILIQLSSFLVMKFSLIASKNNCIMQSLILASVFWLLHSASIVFSCGTFLLYWYKTIGQLPSINNIIMKILWMGTVKTLLFRPLSSLLSSQALTPLCEDDSQSMEIIQRLQKNLDILIQSMIRVSSRSEMLGAIHQVG